MDVVLNVVLNVDNVSIRYITGDFKDIGIKEYIIRKIKGQYQVNEFWADKDVSFELSKGDMLGIVGTNGAGKSTLLKAISGVLTPTKGQIISNGKISALLELGSGFDGDLTVKENVFLRGALLGYSKKFITEKYDEIIEFAELKNFENRPFKQLSSGMQSRLAFSIACLVNPDILILDEVLSVGDGSFQEKSGNRMREILSNGVTGILVSHSNQQIRDLCNKVLWLDHGKQVAFGDAETVVNAYEDFLEQDYNTRKTPENYEELVEMSNRSRMFWYFNFQEEEKMRTNTLDESIKIIRNVESFNQRYKRITGYVEEIDDSIKNKILNELL